MGAQQEILAKLVDENQIETVDTETEIKRPILMAMALDSFGCYVVKTLLGRLDSTADKAAQYLGEPERRKLLAAQQKTGMRILDQMTALGYLMEVPTAGADTQA